MNREEIGKQVREVMKDRMKHQKEVMHEYDALVYLPRIQKLREACSGLGHVKGERESNGFGWSWYWCTVCGASFDRKEE